MSDINPLEDDGELELEPIDPDIIAHQQRRAKQKVREAEDSVDINARYSSIDEPDPFSFSDLRKIRFTTRHLLMLTAAVAILLTLRERMGLFLTFCVVLGVAWWFVLRQEKRQLQEINRLRRKMIAETAARRAREDGEPIPKIPREEFEKVNDQWTAAAEQEPAFHFSFSLKEMFATLTAAAVALGMITFLGDQATIIVGLIALAGLVAQAMGYAAPPILILGWWLMLVLYILLSLMGIFSREAGPVACLFQTELPPVVERWMGL